MNAEQTHDLARTVPGRLRITFEQLRALHFETNDLLRARLVLGDQDYSARMNSIGVRSGAALRESIMAITEALIDLGPRVERIETYLEEIAQQEREPGPGQSEELRRH